MHEFLTILDRKAWTLSWRFALVVGFYAGFRSVKAHEFLAPDAAGLSSLAQITGEIYAVLLAFVIYVTWNEFKEVERLVGQEANAIDDLLRFASNVPDTVQVRKKLSAYAARVVDGEWSLLAGGKNDPEADKLFSEFFDDMFAIVSKNDQGQAIYTQLLTSLDRVNTARDERVAKSVVRIPPTLVSLVSTIAGVLLVLNFLYPFQEAATGLVTFAILAFVLFVAEFVVTDTDNPLEGVCNVSRKPFEDLRSRLESVKSTVH